MRTVKLCTDRLVCRLTQTGVHRLMSVQWVVGRLDDGVVVGQVCESVFLLLH